MKKDLLENGWNVFVRNRKCKSGTKKYFRVSKIDTNEKGPWGGPISIIKKYYPSAYLTSGGGVSQEYTYAEF